MSHPVLLTKRNSAWYFLLPCFILTSLLVLEFGLAERVNIKIILTNREDRYKRATIFIGNATSKTMKNLSLELDLDAIIDNSAKLIGAQGFVREIKRSSPLELSIIGDISKVEQNERSLFLCTEGSMHTGVMP
ncbi:hypothetical protein J437_LFUL017240 [Ladona fulva]|uniref:Uncharacterized protein n=1 Tax=Ladona fulva TaxID=123851 RepID=A0A8K0KPE6_LADFU|nr:hypothetical protein J437_LFUL017240 [Ladona fulva]